MPISLALCRSISTRAGRAQHAVKRRSQRGVAAAHDALAAAQAFRDADEDTTPTEELHRLAGDVRKACVPLTAYRISEHDQWQRCRRAGYVAMRRNSQRQ